MAAPGNKLEKDLISQTKVSELMTKQVHSVLPAATIRDAIQLLLEKKISGAPVVNHLNHVISVISEANLMTLAISDGLDTQISTILDKLPSKGDLIVVKADDKFAKVFEKFLTKPVRRVIVVDDTGLLQGVVSRRDILKAYLENHGTHSKKR